MKALGWWVVIIAVVAVGSRLPRLWGDDGTSQPAPASTPVQAEPPPSPEDEALERLRAEVGTEPWSVAEAQACIKGEGVDIAVDGVYGPQTEAAINADRAKHADGAEYEDQFNCFSGIVAYRRAHPAQLAQTTAPPPTNGAVYSPSPRPAIPYVPPVTVPSYAAPVDYGERTVPVSGYTRRNGTYVAPYMRRPPSH